MIYCFCFLLYSVEFGNYDGSTKLVTATMLLSVMYTRMSGRSTEVNQAQNLIAQCISMKVVDPCICCSLDYAQY